MARQDDAQAGTATELAANSELLGLNPPFTDGPPPPFCLICNDRASGYHYSVYSCEGCKGFFKRSVQKNLSYKCKGEGHCEINKFTRNNCQACRFQKCMDNGMKKEAVREDRAPGGRQGQKRMRHSYHYSSQSDLESTGNSTGSTGSPIDCSSPGEPESDIFYCDDLGKTLVNSKPDLIPRLPDGTKFDSTVAPEPGQVNVMMQLGYDELRMIIEWARKVPGFNELQMEDRMALLKSSFMDLNCLRLSYRCLPWLPKVYFGHGLVLTIEETAGLGWNRDMITLWEQYVERLQEMKVDHVEFCLLNALVLFYPDASGLKDKPKVTSLQGDVLKSLRHYTVSRFNDSRRHAKILLRLPALRTFSSKALESYLSMALDGVLKVDELVTEMLS
ncbi:hypothetical protein Bbelb_374860 [Branchiostoma belcheri]|nr:hypothetical protein Bbelb_374860 [Branchiostoma belcheri]